MRETAWEDRPLLLKLTVKAKELWKEATKGGLKGDRRTQWVMGKLGWDARTDESRLRRLMRQG